MAAAYSSQFIYMLWNKRSVIPNNKQIYTGCNIFKFVEINSSHTIYQVTPNTHLTSKHRI